MQADAGVAEIDRPQIGRQPGAKVDHRDVIRVVLLEDHDLPSARIEGERTDPAVDLRSKRQPGRAIPLGDVVGRDVSYRREVAPYVQIPARVEDESVDCAVDP